jgi:TPR repeat protein/V8-like Glu-specific endopeptidase
MKARHHIAALTFLFFAMGTVFGAYADYRKDKLNRGQMYLFKGEVKDAQRYAEKLIKNNDPAGHTLLGMMHLYGLGLKANVEEGVINYRKAANANYAPGQARMGRALMDGHGVAPDSRAGMELIRKAEFSTHPDALYVVGNYYRDYANSQKQYDRALQLLTQASDAGHILAPYKLSLMYEHGQGVALNAKLAARFSKIGVKRGGPIARTKWAQRYIDKGKHKKAYKILKPGVKLGIPHALNMMGWMLVNGGTGVKPDRQKGIKYIQRAADMGNPQALANLGRVYAGGMGVPANSSLAADYLYKGGVALADSGRHKDAQQVLLDLNRLSPDSGVARRLRARVDNMAPPPQPAKTNVSVHASAAPGSSSRQSKKYKNSGTGWVISPGYIVTNQHVVHRARSVEVIMANGEKIAAKVVAADNGNDLAVLSVASAGLLPPGLPLAKKAVSAGEEVFTIGFPLPGDMGQRAKLTDGIINADSGLGDDPRYYQISVPIQPGNSGGPLLNMRGEVIGITTATLNSAEMLKNGGALPQNVNYAIKSPYAGKLVQSLPARRQVRSQKAAKGNLKKLMKRVRPSVVMVVTK